MIQKDTFTAASTALCPALYRIAQSILHEPHDAQDAVQQALLKAWERRADVDEKRFKAYLTRIVINECHNVQRLRQRVTPTDTLPESAFMPPDTGLREAVDALPEALRTPLLLHYMEGYSQREIADALALHMPQIKSRLFRARKALKARLTEVTDR